MFSFISIVRILSRLRTQIEQLLVRPDVAAVVAHPPKALTEEVAHLAALEEAQERAKKGLVAATAALQKGVREARDMADRNVAGVMLKYSKYAPEMSVVGAKPIGRPRRKAPAPTAPTVTEPK